MVGWFQGGSEYGPRALGNRSIIADPRTPEMKDILNKRVKHRQAFRPFAPIVLEERAAEIFEGAGDSPFMLMAKPVAKAWRDRIPAIVHVDGTARVQTVNQQQNPMLYRLLKEFEALTGVPVLLNTSFNVKGEPIVERPHEAMECFLTTGIDYLALHDIQMTKSGLFTVPVADRAHGRRRPRHRAGHRRQLRRRPVEAKGWLILALVRAAIAAVPREPWASG